MDFPAGEVIGQIEGPWIQWHVLVTKYAWIDYAIYRQLDPDIELARRIAKHGRDLKAGQDGAGKEFLLRFAGFRQGQAGSAGILDLYAYPTSGKITFRPQGPPADAVFAFFYLLVNTLGYAAPDALKLLERLKLVYIEIERAVLSDPWNALPVGAQVTSHFPELPHVPKANVTMKVDKSKTPKDVALSGNGKETVFMDTAMHEAGTFVEYFREHINAAEETADQVAALKDQLNKDLSTIQYVVEGNSESITQHTHREATLNKDLEEVLKRVPPDLQEKINAILNKPGVDLTETNAILLRILDAVQLGQAETRQVIEYQTTETTEQIRGVHAKLEEVQKGHLAQTRFMNRKLNWALRGIEEIQQQLSTMSTGSYRVQKKMQPVYAEVVHFLEIHPNATLGEVALHMQVSLPLAWYYLKTLIKMGLVQRQKGIPQPVPAPKAAPKDETEEFIEDLEALGRDLGVIPPAPAITRKKRGPRSVWLYSMPASQSHEIETPPEKNGGIIG